MKKINHGCSAYKSCICRCNICKLCILIQNSKGLSTKESDLFGNKYIDKYLSDESIGHKDFFKFILNEHKKNNGIKVKQINKPSITITQENNDVPAVSFDSKELETNFYNLIDDTNLIFYTEKFKIDITPALIKDDRIRNWLLQLNQNTATFYYRAILSISKFLNKDMDHIASLLLEEKYNSIILIQTFLFHLMEIKYKPSTINKYLSGLKSWFAFCKKNGFISWDLSNHLFEIG